MFKAQFLQQKNKIDIFTENVIDLESRIISKLSLLEFSALIFNIFMLGGFIYLGTNAYNSFPDFQVYLQAGIGNFITGLEINRGFYYAYWMLPLFTVLNFVPYWLGIFIWGMLNIFGLFFGARIFGNKSSVVLFTYQALFILFMGQITGVIIGGLGILWYGLKTERWLLASFGLIIASTKYHVGGFIALVLLIIINKPFKGKLQVIIYFVIVFVISILIYPNWPIEVIQRVQILPPGDITDISIWRWLGPITLLFWIPPIFLKLSKPDRLIALVTTLCFAIPYFQSYDLLLLWILPVGRLALLGNLAYSNYFLPLVWQRLLVIIPFTQYLMIIYSPLKEQIKRL